MKRDNSIGMGIGIGLFAGLIIGGVAALLYAPKSGEDSRQVIMDKANETMDTVKEKYEDVVDTVKEAASDVNRKGHAAVYAIKH